MLAGGVGGIEVRIKVQTDQGEIKVQAKLYYSGTRRATLAVHRPPGYETGDPDVWNLTHIRSGWAVKLGLTFTDAVFLAETLKGENWEYDTPRETPAET